MPAIDPHPFGSIRGSSTVYSLVEFVHHVQKALDSSGRMVRAFMPDSPKAFDKVRDGSILLRKLVSLGFSCQISC